MNRPIDSIAVGKRTRKAMGDIHTLAASINELGLLGEPRCQQRLKRKLGAEVA